MAVERYARCQFKSKILSGDGFHPPMEQFY